MNSHKVNIIAYKTLCIASCGILFLIGIKILLDDLFVKGAMAWVCSTICSLMLFQRPSLKAWMQIIVVLVVAWMIIGQLASI